MSTFNIRANLGNPSPATSETATQRINARIQEELARYLPIGG